MTVLGPRCGCLAAVKSSTGGCLFPWPVLEMRATEVPLRASAFPRLEETVENGHTRNQLECSDDAFLAELMSACWTMKFLGEIGLAGAQSRR